MEYHGISWNIMEYHGISWNIMEYHGICRKKTGKLCFLSGKPWCLAPGALELSALS